eukprot:TRINITY_DN68478_c0_g1_i1.p1 TRINITY_DN68478_c0_g1~~TRINITY_DN68478_c0_g1_i1.p1  ORF type:complete len:492 (+),score=42.37 TRINITY_DN68478_c0_g1_i1:274-1749(+)
MPDVKATVESLGFGRYQSVMALCLGGIYFVEGSNIAATASLLDSLGVAWNLSQIQRGAILSAICLGIMMGTAVSGFWADLMGRRPVILASSFGCCTFGLCSACVFDVRSMIILRFAFGFSVGMGVVPLNSMSIECTPRDNQIVQTCLANVVAFSLGEMYGSALVVVYAPDLEAPNDEWRYIIGLSVIPTLMIIPFAVLLLQESPAYLDTHGRYLESLMALMFIGRVNGKHDIVAALERDFVDLFDAAPGRGFAEPFCAVTDEFGRRPSQLAPEEAHAIEFRENSFGNVLRTLMFSKVFRPLAFGGTLIYATLQFSLFGIAVSFPVVLGLALPNTHKASVLMAGSVFDLIGSFLAILIVSDKPVDYRMWLQFCLSIMGCLMFGMISSCNRSLFVITIASAFILKTIVMVYWVVVTNYNTELFPVAFRCTALSICLGTGRSMSVFTPFIFRLGVVSDSEIGPHGYFWLGASAICIVVLGFVRWNNVAAISSSC